MSNQLPGGTPKSVQGPIDRVPCPHCGKPNNCRVMQEQQLFDTGHCLFCDYCDRSMEVVSIRQITVISVRRDPSGKVAPRRRAQQRQQQQRQQQQPQKPGFFQRLLGPGPGRK